MKCICVKTRMSLLPYLDPHFQTQQAKTRVWFFCSKSLTLVFLFLLGCQDKSTDPNLATTPGVIRTWAGTGIAGFNGDGKPLLETSFYFPVDMTITPTGEAYILDWNNHRVRRVGADSTPQTVIGSDFVGDGPLDQSDTVAPGAIGTSVYLNHPTHILALPNGKILLTAWHNHKLRIYDPVTELVQIICGAGAGFSGDGSNLSGALINQPTQCIRATNGSLYIFDQRNQRIRKIAADSTIGTVVGTGIAGFSGDGGPPLDAQINQPTGSNPPPGGGLALDAQGRLYFSDVLNHRIRRVDFQLNTIVTIAGDGNAGFRGDGGQAKSASLNNPRDLAIGPNGRLYIADEMNHRVREVDLSTGVITTVAGNGLEGFSGDGEQATSASLNRPAGLEFDANGYLYIMDTYNHRIRRVTP